MITAKISVNTVCAVKRLKGSTPEWVFIGLDHSQIFPVLEIYAVKSQLPLSWDSCSRNWRKYSDNLQIQEAFAQKNNSNYLCSLSPLAAV